MHNCRITGEVDIIFDQQQVIQFSNVKLDLDGDYMNSARVTYLMMLIAFRSYYDGLDRWILSNKYSLMKVQK